MFTFEEISRLPYRRGPFDAKVAFVGEAPGEHEESDLLKRPFIGPSGHLLEEIMRAIGIDPSQVYFTNVYKERPDEKKIEKWMKLHPDKDSIYTTLLDRELASLPNLNLIVPVGLISIKKICGKNSIESWRGSIIPATLSGVKGKKCVSIIHTAAILRNWLYKPATVIDMQRIKEEMEFPEIKLPEREYKIRPTFEEVMDEISMWKSSKDLLSIDLETLPNPQRIVLFQGCVSPKRAMAIPLQYKNGKDYWSEDQELLIWKALVDLLHNCGRRIIGQNILTFDIFMFGMYGFSVEKILENVFLDTMEAFQCLEPQLPMGLDFLTSVYTREPYYKSEGKEWGTKQGEVEFWTYGCKDVMVVHEIAPQLFAELEEEKLLPFYQERFQDLAKQRLQMTRTGLRIDEPKRVQLEAEFSRNILIEQARLNVLAGENLNVKSPKQMQTFLYDKMKLPKQWSKTGEITTDEDAILTLSAKYPSKAFEHILTIRNRRTLLSNNIRAKKDSDGRIRCSFGFAETGRFRSYGCPLGSGGNLQNWTPIMRVMVVPDPGYVFLEPDFSQAEARVVAYEGHIQYMIDVFKAGGDIHATNAAMIYDKLLSEITKKSVERYAAKQLLHAADYDIHGPTFAKTYNKKSVVAGYPLISIAEATSLLNKYHEKVPELRNNYHKNIREQVEKTKILWNPFGRRMKFHERVGNELYRQAYNWFAQSTVADAINVILKVISAYYTLLLQVHDSILIQCKPNQIKDAITIMNEANPEFIVGGMPLRIPLEFKISETSWYDMSEYTEKIAA